MKLVEPNEETYALWINKEDFTLFDLFYTNLGYKALDGRGIGQFPNRYGNFIVHKPEKTIGFIGTVMFAIYQDKDYAIRELIELEE